MPPVSFGRPTKSEIEKAAHATVTGLETCGFSTCCLVGSAACMTYGMTRVPNDIDIVVLNTNSTQEEIKRRLVSVDPLFFLIPSTNPRNTYKVLWYNLHPRSSFPSHACKVDILIPGILNIPAVPKQLVTSSHIKGHGLVPVMPFIVMLLLKLQGWSDHRGSRWVNLQIKQYVDARDINELLQMVVRDGKFDVRKEGWLPASFVRDGKSRATAFIREYPSSSVYWKQIGLVDQKMPS